MVAPARPKLSLRHAIFAEKYAQLGSSRAAAIAAGYSQRTAHAQGSRLLKNAEIVKQIERERVAHVEIVQIERAEVVAILANIARTDLRDVMEWDDDGSYLVPSAGLSRAASAAVKEIRFTTKPGRKGEPPETQVRVVLHDKIAAASKLAELQGWTPDRNGIGGGSVHVGDNVQVVMTGPEMLEAVQRVYGLAAGDVIEGE